jgi:hypothetical protein
MKKWIANVSYIIIVILAVALCIQYQNNNKAIDTLGSVYLSNMESFKQHINHVQTYLQNEKKFKDSDLLNYYYEVNYLLTIRLPSQSCTGQYISSIQSGISEMQSMVSNNAKKEDVEAVRKRTLQFIEILKYSMDKMSTVGRVKVGDEVKEDYKKYYQLSLPNNKTMQLINDDLQKQLDVLRNTQQ